MSGQSGIEWTDATWNPVRGCVKVSPGCKHCYAETFAERFRGVAGHAYEQGFDPRLVPEALDLPLHWRKPRDVFVNSMSDLFGDFVPRDYVAACFGVMAAAPRHTFQLLTKRADRLSQWFDWLERLCEEPECAHERCPVVVCVSRARKHLGFREEFVGLAARVRWPLPHVWLGVSVEDRRFGLPRVERLREVPAAVRFLSIEPLLEDIGTLDLRGISWVIVGGESGPGAREMRTEWVRSIRDQCLAAGVAFFFKQWGGVRKKLHGRTLDGRTWDDMPRRGASVVDDEEPVNAWKLEPL